MTEWSFLLLIWTLLKIHHLRHIHSWCIVPTEMYITWTWARPSGLVAAKSIIIFSGCCSKPVGEISSILHIQWSTVSSTTAKWMCSGILSNYIKLQSGVCNSFQHSADSGTAALQTTSAINISTETGSTRRCSSCRWPSPLVNRSYTDTDSLCSISASEVTGFGRRRWEVEGV